MRTIVRVIFLALLFLTESARAAVPLTLYLSTPPMPAASEAWPTMPPQPLPKGLRPCCAFGYDLHAELLGLPVPFYELNNVVTVDSLGIISTTTICIRAWQTLPALAVRITVLCIPCVADSSTPHMCGIPLI
ncbi:Uncharacterised protein [Salmonella bongori]|nr:Uncharacterised protein [Salmonella bongori]